MTRSVWWLVLAGTFGGCVDSTTEPAPTSQSAAGPRATPMPRTWRKFAATAPLQASAPALMLDGTVIVQDYGTDHWWKLTPDAFGQYDTGTWTQIADSATNGTADGYAPLFDAEAVLPDGRLIVEGGEYLGQGGTPQPTWTTNGAIYDPIANKWTKVDPPKPWTSEPDGAGNPTGGTIGDASGIVLADGTFMLSNCCTPEMAKLDAATLTWTPAGQNKADTNDEESWSILFDGRIVTADAEGGLTGSDFQHSEIYDPKADTWSALPMVPVELDQVNPASPNPPTSSHEVGPEMTRADGTIVAIGGTPHNAVFDPGTMSWTALADTPGGFATVDGPGTSLPNGDVLFATAPPYNGDFPAGTKWYELSGTTFTQVGGTTSDAQLASYQNFLLVLPTGEILHTQIQSAPGNELELYTPAAGVAPNAVPEILGEPQLIGTGDEAPTAPVPTIYKGRSYTMPIARMNGLWLGATYGDDAQAATNFPIVRVTASGSGHVWYCRTYDATDRSTSPDEQGTATFDLPATIEGGTAEIAVVANGIPSAPFTVNIK
jgi:hypothetical protein